MYFDSVPNAYDCIVELNRVKLNAAGEPAICAIAPVGLDLPPENVASVRILFAWSNASCGPIPRSTACSRPASNDNRLFTECTIRGIIIHNCNARIIGSFAISTSVGNF